MKYLIVNADDFGLTKGVCDGIIETFQHGIVRSTTMFANTDHFDYAVGLAKENPGLGVGVHLNLTYGKPVSKDVPSLVDRTGSFFKSPVVEANIKNIKAEEIEAEFASQTEKIINAGIEITHFDTYHNIHKIPKINEIVASLALKYDVGIRRTDNPCLGVKSTEEFCDKFYNEMATNMNFKMLVKKYQRKESMEIMCHPAYCDVELMNVSRYSKKREIELSVLTAYELQVHLEKLDILITNYNAI